MSAMLLLTVTVISAIGGYIFAQHKGRAPQPWVFLCVLFGPVPLIPLAFLPARAPLAG